MYDYLSMLELNRKYKDYVYMELKLTMLVIQINLW